MKFECKAKDTRHAKLEEKDLVYVNDVEDLIKEVCSQRNLSSNDCMIRIGMDGGQGSLKVVMNLFDPEDMNNDKNKKMTGVNKAILLAFVKDINETNSNLGKILEHVKLETIKYHVAADLKLVNCLLGISVSILITLLLNIIISLK